MESLLKDIILHTGLDYIKSERVICVRSEGSKSKAIARCWGFPTVWKTALNMDVYYVIEVISERFDKLSYDEKVKVLIHELMHIPKSFSGGLRSHNHFSGRVKDLHKIYKKRKK